MILRIGSLASLALILLLAACGDDGTPAPATTTPTQATATASVPPSTPTATPDRRTPTPTPTAPPNLTSQQVCDLVPASSVARALGVDSVERETVDSPTPQCSYRFATEDGSNNVALAVMSDADVGGRTGADAFEYAVSLNRAFAGDSSTETEVPNLGDQAVFMSGPAVSLLIVQAGLRVVTVSGTELTAQQAAAIALGAVEY